MDKTTEEKVAVVQEAVSNASEIYEKHLKELEYTITNLQNEKAQLSTQLSVANLKVAELDGMLKAQTSATSEKITLEDYIDETELAEAYLKD